MNRTSATVVADSIAYDHRLTTLELVMHPRAVEHMLTHRGLSRNGASRRAIPLRKQIEDVESDECFPVFWGSEQRGMQAGAEIDALSIVLARQSWRVARRHAIVAAKHLGALGIHKEIASAPLHPYQWRTYLVSATDEVWAHFLHLRLSPKAQAEIRTLAQAVDQALNSSTPTEVLPGDWHLPYMEDVDLDECAFHRIDPRMVSAMRCARVSYKTHPVLAEDGKLVEASKRDVRFDADKGWGLSQAEHWSPFEHVATPAGPMIDTANFRGWQQLRTVMGA